MTDRQVAGRSGLVDNWLEAASESSDMRVRGNAVIALVTIGGQKRMEMLARLIGQTATEVHDGLPGRPEIIRLARQEIGPLRLGEADRKLLDGILDGRDDIIPQRERETARGILQDGSLWRQRQVYRRLEPRWSLFNLELLRTIVREAVAGTVLVGIALWLITKAVYGDGLPLNDTQRASRGSLSSWPPWQVSAGSSRLDRRRPACRRAASSSMQPLSPSRAPLLQLPYFFCLKQTPAG